MDVRLVGVLLAVSWPDHITTLTTIETLAGESATLPCSDSDPSYPEWRGPSTTGGDVSYNYPGDSDIGNPKVADKKSRLGWDPIDNRSLVIQNVTRLDAGIYTCTLRPSMAHSINLTVRVLPTPAIKNTGYIDGSRPIIADTEGKPLNITCTASGGIPEPRLTLYKHDNTSEPLTTIQSVEAHADGSYTVTQTFFIVPTRADDRVVFVCQASLTNPYKAYRTMTAELYLNLLPIGKNITSQPVLEGVHGVIGECVMEGFRPGDAQVSWRVGNTSYTGNGTITIMAEDQGPETYSVTAVLSTVLYREAQGQLLECLVFHESWSSPAIASTLLDVKYHPKVTLYGPTEAVNGQTDLQPMMCIADSNPPPLFTWYLGDKVLANKVTSNYDGNIDLVAIGNPSNTDLVARGNMTYVSIIYLPKMSMETSGNYTCVVDNGVHPGVDQITLVVGYKAEITKLSYFNETRTLQCDVDSHPAAYISLYNKGILMANSTGVTSLYYVIDGSDCMASDLYTCTAYNKYNNEDLSTASISVKVWCGPQTIETVMVDSHDKAPVQLLLTMIAYPIPERHDVTWSTYTDGAWRELGGGYITPLTNDTFKCGLNLTDVNDLQYGYYRVNIWTGNQHDPFVHIFDVTSNGIASSTSEFHKVQEAMSAPGMTGYVVASTVGLVTGILLASVFCCVWMNRCRGTSAKSFGPNEGHGNKRKEVNGEIVYEEIDAIPGRRSGYNIYCDLHETTGKPANEPCINTDKSKNDEDTKPSSPNAPSVYMDMTMTLKAGGNNDKNPSVSQYTCMQVRGSHDNLCAYANTDANLLRGPGKEQPDTTGCKNEVSKLYANLPEMENA